MTKLQNTAPIMVSGDMPLEAAPQEGIPGVLTRVTGYYETDLRDSGMVAIPSGTSIPELQRMIHEWAISKEWRGPKAETQRTTGDDIALMVSEAAEALEAFRLHADPTEVWYTYTIEVEGVKFKDLTIDQVKVLLQCDTTDEAFLAVEDLGIQPKPEGVGPELADLVIRVLDYCAEHNLELLHFIMEKMAHNQTRPIRHGGMHL